MRGGSYRDRLLSPELFQWESQNRTVQESKHGQMIRHHERQGTAVHLFVKKTAKLSGRGAAPFVYCGDVTFQDWGGERPITVRWKLPDPVPGRLADELLVQQR